MLGNYRDNLWNVKENAKYSEDNGKTFYMCPYQKKTPSSILLTTGADESFSLSNIYDIVGNVWEWTLEKKNGADEPCTLRGCAYTSTSSDIYAGYHNGNVGIDVRNYNIGFRIVIY